MRAFRRLWFVITRQRQDDDLAAELEFHRQMKADELRADGVREADVASRTQRALGNDLLARERARDVWVWPWLQDIGQDLRFGLRMLLKERQFAVAAIVTLALGIAVNNAVFTIINAAVLRDLPFERPDRLITIRTIDPRGFEDGVSHPNFQDWQSQTTVFEAIAASSGASLNLSDASRPAERVSGAFFSHEVIGVLRVAPIIGRAILPEDDREGAPGVALLSYGLWQTRYGGDAAVLGHAIRINETPATIIGVMPEGFGFPLTAELWQPLSAMPGLKGDRRSTALNVVGRLKDGATLTQAKAEIETVAARIAQQHSDTSKDLKVAVFNLKEGAARGAAPFLMTLFGAVAVVLLISCANVANLLLARSAQRGREIAVRAAMGASRWRIVRQLLIECFLIAVAASALGLYLSFYGAEAMSSAFNVVEIAAPDRENRPYWVDLSMDAVAWTFLTGVCLFSSIAAGLVPALHLSRTNVNEVLKESGRTGAGTVRARKWASGLMVAQLALAVVLLTAAGMFTRGFFSLYYKDLMIPTSDLVTMRVSLPRQKYATADAQRRFVQQLDERLTASPAFAASTIGSDIPLQPLVMGGRDLTIPGRAGVEGEAPPSVTYVNVGDRYLETIGLPIARGRALTADDSLGGREGAIVNERFAAMFFPDADALGQRVQLTARTPGSTPGPLLTIVGIVPTLPNFMGRFANDATIYVPITAEPALARTLSILVRGPSKAATAAALREQVRAIDADLPVFAIQTMDEAVARSRWGVRIIGSWFLTLAGIALVLAAVGLYAITAHGVTQRTQEIGVRMALGATASQVVWLFVRRSAWHIAAGLAVGLTGAFAVAGALRSLVRDVEPRDPLTFLVVSALLIAVALTASIWPARKATRVDPMHALRAD